MDHNKLSRVKEAMKNDGIDQMLLADPVSVCYLTGRMINCMERMMVLLIDVEGVCRLVIGKLFPQPEETGLEVIYFEDQEDCVEILSNQLRKNTVVGIDKIWPSGYLLRLMKLGAGREYVNASYIIDRVRQVKDADEQEKMRAASRLNDSVMEQMIPLVTKGYTELELQEKLSALYKERGGFWKPHMSVIAYGENAADPHHEPNETTGRTSDAVILDIGCRKDGYYCDMTRTVFIGRVSDEARKIYEIVLEANRRGIAAVRPGARFCDVDYAARDYITQQGYGPYFTHRTGHGIGMEIHEYGDVSSSNEDILKPGMCFSVEPGIYLPGTVGVRIEDLVMVTEEGFEVLNHVSKDLTVIPEKISE